MATLYNKTWSRNELLYRVGDINQVAGITPVELTDGNSRGIRALRFTTGSGLSFTVLPDRGMDIYDANYNGAALGWQSCTGPVAPAFFEPEGAGWLRSFAGGLLTTCGLENAGPSVEDQHETFGLHGRISHCPAKSVAWGADWEGDEYVLWASGIVRETRVFGVNLVLRRSIHARLGQSRIWIQDEIENQGFEETEMMLLYHFNIGFPVVDAGSELLAVIEDLEARDKVAEPGIDTFDSFEEPQAGYLEQCFFIDQDIDERGIVNSAIVNRHFNNNQGIGFFIAYPREELPRFTQWKMMNRGTYVVGLEPGTCLPEGRLMARKRGDIKTLLPGGSWKTHIELGVLTSNNDIRAFESKLRGMDL